MRKIILMFLISIVLCSSVYAGYRSGSFRSYSRPSRVYVAPRTVVRNYHVENHSGSSGGIHPLAAGAIGYMLGSSTNERQQVIQQAPAQVPQQVIQQPVVQQQSASPQIENDNNSAWHFIFDIIIVLGCLIIAVPVIVYLSNRH